MNPVRAAAQRVLDGVPGAFLRCDRGTALYVTNAEMKAGRSIDWAEAGFEARRERGLTFLVPQRQLLDDFRHWAETQNVDKRLSRAIKNACFAEVMPEDAALWIEGIKRFEMNGDAAGYEKLVRQRAAVCLREKKGGGMLYECALLADIMNRGEKEHED